MPEKKQKKITKKKIIVLIVILSLVILGFAFGVGTIVWTTTAKVRSAAKSFITIAESGNVTGAYDSASEAFRSVTTAEELGIFLETFPVEPESIKFSYISIKNGVATLSGTVTVDGEESPITFTLVKEDGYWKIVNFSLNPNDVPQE